MSEEFKIIPSRTSDPETSHKAEKSIQVSARNQQGKLLKVYRQYPEGLTSEEAMERSDEISFFSNWWHRASDLKDGKFIELTGEERKGNSGRYREVCAITEKGLNKLRELGL